MIQVFHRTPKPAGEKRGLPVQLYPLTPIYEPESHYLYVELIEQAINQATRTGIRNIALTGSYGIGKSSVLQRVAETYGADLVQISLSTLGPWVPEPTTDPSIKTANTPTNRIQKEIVKQLLYREAPSRFVGSRYRRLQRFQFWRAFGVAILAGSFFTVLFLILGFTLKLDTALLPYTDLPNRGSFATLLITTAIALLFQQLFHNHIRVDQLSAGAATISLSGSSTSFFDEYLDEIVYFFDVTGTKIVVLEDIDRFDDPQIFETLRALNMLLNNARQLNGRTICFVYAIKDSIFEELGRSATHRDTQPADLQGDTAQAELARANRTKFFDLIVPMVPFVSHRNARDLVVRVMRDTEHNVSLALIDLTARHIPDMRLIKNIRNEFVIFRDKIILGKESVPELNEDRLFAMLLYKSTHLSDFESMKLRKGNLDQLYDSGRNLVTECIAAADAEDRQLRRRLNTLDAAASRSEQLGDQFLRFLDRLVAYADLFRQYKNYTLNRVVTLAGVAQSDADLRAVAFWHAFAQGGSSLDVTLSSTYEGPHIINLSQADVAEFLGVSLSIDDWAVDIQMELNERRSGIAEERSFFHHATLSSLLTITEFNSDSVREKCTSFRQSAPSFLQSDLARQLVEGGYIGWDFALYTSTYYEERLSARATNFLVHTVDRNLSDPHFLLEPLDVERIIEERGTSILRERGAYNVHMLDFLLEVDKANAETLVDRLTVYGDDEKSFLRAYLAGGKQQDALISTLANRWSLIFRFIVDDPDIDEAMRVRMFDVALKNMDNPKMYAVDQRTRAFIEEHFRIMGVLVSNETTADTTDRVSELLVATGARLVSLAPLGPEMKKSAVASNRYRISQENLMVALGGSDDLALDSIRQNSTPVYTHVLKHMTEYLAARRESTPEPLTVRSGTAFAQVLQDVVTHAEDALEVVIASASSECEVADLSDVPQIAWRSLAGHLRFPATFPNISAYVREAGEVDAPLASLLQASGAISVDSDIEESEKQELASVLLSAPDTLAAKVRVALVVSLNLEGELPVASVSREPGELTGLLIEHRVIADDADSFAITLGSDWDTRQFAISRSRQFLSYMTPTEVPVGDVAPLMRSSLVPDAVKRKVLDQVDDFVPTNELDPLSAVAEYAYGHSIKLSAALIARMASARLDRDLVLRLLVPLLPELAEDELVPVLTSLGGDLAKIAQRSHIRPKIARTDAHLALVERLKELGVVSSSEPTNGLIEVRMKRP